MDKYATHLDAFEIISEVDNTVSSPSNENSTKLITKNNLTLYNAKVSDVPSKQYTNNQCVLKKDIVPINTNGPSLRLSSEIFGTLDTALSNIAFYYVNDRGTNVGGGNDGWSVLLTDEGGIYYPNENNIINYLIPYNSSVAYYPDYICGGSDVYSSGGVGGLNYVLYGMGYTLIGDFYSYYNSSDIVYVIVAAEITFFDGTMYRHNQKYYPTTVVEGYDGSNTVYKHSIKIRYNYLSEGFIDCGVGQVKNVNLTISIYAAP